MPALRPTSLNPDQQDPQQPDGMPQMPQLNIPKPGMTMSPAGPSDPTGGAGGASGQTPRERQPGNGPIATPPQSQSPSPSMGGQQAFGGGGSSTMSPPSMTTLAPFAPMAPPSPNSMVFGENPAGGGLMGKSGGLQGGGLNTPGGFGTQGSDPNSLIMTMLKLLGGGQ